MSHSVPLTTSRTAATPSGPLARAVAAATASMAGLVREYRVQRALHQLEGLDDRMLADLGIGHGQVESAVRHGRDAARSGRPYPVRHAARLDLGAGWTDWR